MTKKHLLLLLLFFSFNIYGQSDKSVNQQMILGLVKYRNELIVGDIEKYEKSCLRRTPSGASLTKTVSTEMTEKT